MTHRDGKVGQPYFGFAGLHSGARGEGRAIPKDGTMFPHKCYFNENVHVSAKTRYDSADKLLLSLSQKAFVPEEDKHRCTYTQQERLSLTDILNLFTRMHK